MQLFFTFILFLAVSLVSYSAAAKKADPDFLKSSVTLEVNARPTRYIDIYENAKLPAVVVQVRTVNHAGHEIPHPVCL
ncbi:MAG: hypothetical protein HZA14_10175 [Nitrospirae bacterium]|nr:hypothetical protein [Nitrospirota bacterium]